MSNDQKTDAKPEDKAAPKKAKADEVAKRAVQPETSTQDASSKRLAELEAQLAQASAKIDALKEFEQRCLDLEGRCKELDERFAKQNHARNFEGKVFWDGEYHDVVGTFRADNTFAEVKRGHCPEGVTLIAIAKSH